MYINDLYISKIDKYEIVLCKKHLGGGDIHVQMDHIVSFEYYSESLEIKLINNDKYYISCEPPEFVKVSCKPEELLKQIKRLIDSARHGKIRSAFYDISKGQFNVYT